MRAASLGARRQHAPMLVLHFALLTTANASRHRDTLLISVLYSCAHVSSSSVVLNSVTCYFCPCQFLPRRSLVSSAPISSSSVVPTSVARQFCPGQFLVSCVHISDSEVLPSAHVNCLSVLLVRQPVAPTPVVCQSVLHTRLTRRDW